MIPNAFIAKRRASALKERPAAREHVIDLRRLPGEPTPAEADATCVGGARENMSRSKRMASVAAGMVGKRLVYRGLVADDGLAGGARS